MAPTVATNAVVERRLAATALITNEGFRDVLAIGTQMRTRVYDLWTPEPAPIVPRDLCLGVRGRIDAEGMEVEPLNEQDVYTAAASLRDRGVEAVAVMLLFSFLNPTTSSASARSSPTHAQGSPSPSLAALCPSSASTSAPRPPS